MEPSGAAHPSTQLLIDVHSAWRVNANRICLCANSPVLNTALCKWDFTQWWTGLLTASVNFTVYTIVYILFSFQKDYALSHCLTLYSLYFYLCKSLVCDAIFKSREQGSFKRVRGGGLFLYRKVWRCSLTPLRYNLTQYHYITATLLLPLSAITKKCTD